MYRWILAYLHLRIEWNWQRILRNRRRMAALVRQGEPYTSQRLVELDVATGKLGVKAQSMAALYYQVQRRAA